MLNVHKRIPTIQLMTLCVAPLNVFVLSVLLLLSGCSTSSRTSIESQWPLQAGSEDFHQYYEGEPLPLEEIAVLDVRNPLGIMKEISPMALVAKRDYCYSGKFALKPGKQTLSLSYFRSSGVTYYSSLKPFEVQFYAEKSRRYRAFYMEGYELDAETNNKQSWNSF
ncbi:MAG: hypothetical protein ACJAT5_000532 [Lentimonas sp.]|jgi:hypothetical protein